MANSEVFKNINVSTVENNFKVSAEKQNCKINYGMNMSTENKQPKNWEINMENLDNGFLLN